MLFVHLMLTWFGMDKLPESTVPANTLQELVNATGKPQVLKHVIDLVRSKTLVIIAHRNGKLYSRFCEVQQKASGWKVAGR